MKALVVAGAAGSVVVVAALVFVLVAWRRVHRFHVHLKGSPPGGTTYLLIGSDSRAHTPGGPQEAFGSTQASPGDHADVVLLLRTGDHGRQILGVPRDLTVQTTGGAPARLALTFGAGPQGVVDGLCHTLGVGVDHVVVVHFDGLVHLVDLVGGVDVHVDAPTRDLQSGFVADHAGSVRLNGEQALAFVRARHLEERTDAGWRPLPPTADQRPGAAEQVLGALGAKLHLSAGSPLSSIQLLWAAAGALELDNHTSMTTVLHLLHQLNGLDQAHRLALPVVAHPGPTPMADLLPSAASVLASFGESHGSAGCTAHPIPIAVAS